MLQRANFLSFVQAVEGMQRADSEFGKCRLNKQREFDLRGGYGANIDSPFRERAESLCCNAGMAAHADTDDRYLRNLRRTIESFIPDVFARLGDGVLSTIVVCRRNREGEIGGGTVSRYVLHDHVYVDICFGERTEDRCGDARLVLHPADRNLGFVLGEGDTGDDLLFHDLLLVANEGAGRVPVRVDILRPVEARAHEDTDVVHHPELDRAHLQHLGTQRGQLQHFLERDFVETTRFGDHAWVGGIDAIDIGVDVAPLGANSGRDRDRRGVGAATPKGGDAACFLMQALKTGNHGDLAPLVEALHQFGAVDVQNTC